MYRVRQTMHSRRVPLRLRWCLQRLVLVVPTWPVQGWHRRWILRCVHKWAIPSCCRRDRLQHVPCWSVPGRQRKFHVQKLQVLLPRRQAPHCLWWLSQRCVRGLSRGPVQATGPKHDLLWLPKGSVRQRRGAGPLREVRRYHWIPGLDGRCRLHTYDTVHHWALRGEGTDPDHRSCVCGSRRLRRRRVGSAGPDFELESRVRPTPRVLCVRI